MDNYGLQLPVKTVYAVFEDGSRLDIACTDSLDAADAKNFYDIWNGWHEKKLAAVELRLDSNNKVECDFSFIPDYKVNIPFKESIMMNRKAH